MCTTEPSDKYICNFSENTFISRSDQPEYSKLRHSPIPQIVQSIHNGWLWSTVNLLLFV